MNEHEAENKSLLAQDTSTNIPPNIQHEHSHSQHHAHAHHHHHGHTCGHHHHHHHGDDEAIGLLSFFKFSNFQDLITQTKQHILAVFQVSMQQEQTRKLLYFCCTLFGLSLLHLIVGFTVSKSLIVFLSAFHTLQRCLHHAITLITRAAQTMNSDNIVRRKFSLATYSFGFERIEVVLRFANGIFVIFLALACIKESVERWLDPHDLSMYVPIVLISVKQFYTD